MIFDIAVFNYSLVLNCISSLQIFLTSSPHLFSIEFESIDNDSQGRTLIFFGFDEPDSIDF